MEEKKLLENEDLANADGGSQVPVYPTIDIVLERKPKAGRLAGVHHLIESEESVPLEKEYRMKEAHFVPEKPMYEQTF